MKGLKSWPSVDDSSNMLGLLSCIEQVIFSKGGEVYCVNAIIDGFSQYLNCKQNDLDNVTYQNKLDSYRKALKAIGITIIFAPVVEMARTLKYPAVPVSSLTPAMLSEIEQDGADIMHAGLIIKNADKSRYGELNADMSNAYTFGRNQYPTTTEDARRILDKFKPIVPIVTKKEKSKWKERKAEGMKTVQEEEDDNILFTTTAEGKRVPICYNCRKSGHYQNECTNPAWKEGDVIGTQMCILGQVDESSSYQESNQGSSQPISSSSSKQVSSKQVSSSLSFLQAVQDDYDDDEEDIN